jgi:hypothetical protein
MGPLGVPALVIIALIIIIWKSVFDTPSDQA